MILIIELARELKGCLLGTSLCRCTATGALGFNKPLGLSCAGVLQESREGGGFMNTAQGTRLGGYRRG